MKIKIKNKTILWFTFMTFAAHCMMPDDIEQRRDAVLAPEIPEGGAELMELMRSTECKKCMIVHHSGNTSLLFQATVDGSSYYDEVVTIEVPNHDTTLLDAYPHSSFVTLQEAVTVLLRYSRHIKSMQQDYPKGRATFYKKEFDNGLTQSEILEALKGRFAKHVDLKKSLIELRGRVDARNAAYEAEEREARSAQH